MLGYLLLLLLSASLLPAHWTKNLSSEVGGYGHTLSRLQEVDTTRNIDLLFLGPSLAYRGFDIRIFRESGYRSFNLGTGSQSSLQTQLLLDRYLERLSPRFVIYEVYPWCFTTDGVESTLDIALNDEMGNDFWQLGFRQNHLKIYHTLLYAQFRSYLYAGNAVREEVNKKEDTYIQGGFVRKSVSYYLPEETYPRQEWKWNEAQFQVFESILQQLKEAGAEVVLVRAPVSEGWYNAHTNNAGFDERMQAYAPYFNFNEIMALEDTLHFYDYQHLNQKGVEAFNRRLIEILEKEAYLYK
jgi:poly-D-alanine transfer protein DltD